MHLVFERRLGFVWDLLSGSSRSLVCDTQCDGTNMYVIVRAHRGKTSKPWEPSPYCIKKNFDCRISMSLVVSLLLARPGGDSGGAEAPPLRVRAHEAALEHACCRRHGPTPGAGRRVGQAFGESEASIFAEHHRIDPLSCDEPREGGLCDSAGAAARGALVPCSPAAAEAHPAEACFAPSTSFARLTTPPCCECGGGLVRCAWPRVARLAPAKALIF